MYLQYNPSSLSHNKKSIKVFTWDTKKRRLAGTQMYFATLSSGQPMFFHHQNFWRWIYFPSSCRQVITKMSSAQLVRCPTYSNEPRLSEHNYKPYPESGCYFPSGDRPIDNRSRLLIISCPQRRSPNYIQSPSSLTEMSLTELNILFPLTIVKEKLCFYRKEMSCSWSKGKQYCCTISSKSFTAVDSPCTRLIL